MEDDAVAKFHEWKDWVGGLAVGDEVIIHQPNRGCVEICVITKVTEVKIAILRTESGHRVHRRGIEIGLPYRSKEYFELARPTDEGREVASYHASEEGKRHIALLTKVKTANWLDYPIAVLEDICGLLDSEALMG